MSGASPGGNTVSAGQQITFTLDGRRVDAHAQETIWLVARRHGVTIPHACLSSAPDFRPDGNCRLCVVEVEGFRTLQPSCLMKASDGLVVHTGSQRAAQARRLIMELLLAEADIDPGSECGRAAPAMGVTASRFRHAEVRLRPDDSHPGIAVNLAKCIHCMRCVQACREVEVNNVSAWLGAANWPASCSTWAIRWDKSTCVSCGSCAQACPTGAIAFKPSPDA